MRAILTTIFIIGLVHVAWNQTLEIHPESGLFHSSAQVEISGEIDEKIFYTLDGSDPDENSIRYQGPFMISGRRPVHWMNIPGSGIRIPL